jgi:hypothetical protein
MASHVFPLVWYLILSYFLGGCIACGWQLLSFPFAGVAVMKQAAAQRSAARETDRRVNFINEFVQGIRVVKFYAWERRFIQTVDQAREAEMTQMRRFLVFKVRSFLFVELL